MSTPPTADQYAADRPGGAWDPAAASGPGPDAPPPWVPPRRRARRLLRGGLAGLGLVALVAAALVVAGYYYRDAPITADAGDCVHNTGTTEDPEVSVVPCSAPEAEFVVIKMIHLVNEDACDEVPGTIATYREERRSASFSLCLGRNDYS
ncbi:LppU/SCO3897 family protein [Kitasatospora sp. NPDC001664]